MKIEITLKNYRCFPDSNPAKFSIRNGFTAFVGANNSGKSTILRFFYEANPLFAKLVNHQDLNAGLEREFGVQFQGLKLDAEEVFSNSNNRPMQIELTFVKEDEEDWAFERVVFLLTAQRPTTNFHLDLLIDEKKIHDGARFINNKELRFPAKEPPFDFTPIFSALKMLGGSFYFGPFRNALNLGASGPNFNAHVGKQFIEMWAARQTSQSVASSNITSKIERDLENIFDLPSLRINPIQDHSDFQIQINGRTTLLSTMGSGFTQFLLLLGNVAFVEPSFILIDEPESNLHPALQLEFLTTLGKYAKDNFIFFSTHNLGLARSGAEFIYCTRTNSEGVADVKAYEGQKNLSELLGELSYSHCEILGFQKILLVEGPTDIKVIRHFLRLLGKDHKVFLMPLHGGTQIHGSDHTESQLTELKARVGDVSALIDSEKASAESDLDPNRQAFLNLCRKADINCQVLKRRALENYFTDDAIKRVFGSQYSKLDPFEKLGQESRSWGKNGNWRIALEMSIEDLNGTDLGRFLKSL